jgi:hypothetical protein
MTANVDNQQSLEDLDARLRTVLPETYKDTYEEIQPVSMGSAGLKYAADGTVAWDQMWGSFCDLAMAGGPPHKGTLLEPGARAAIEAQPDRYREITNEICRGVTLVTELPAEPSPNPGWVSVDCYSEGMAQWLLRAITMENVAARADRRALDLPAGPAFRIEKEIKNVITVIAKTCHYWLGHMSREQKVEIACLFAALSDESPLVEPAFTADHLRTPADATLCAAVAADIQRRTGLPASPHRYAGWLGVECPSVRAAVWMMRAMVVSNVLSRREESVLFVPINAELDADGHVVTTTLARVHALASARGIVSR